jgi:CubicO group peptidase (beta-lactamase class C family)
VGQVGAAQAASAQPLGELAAAARLPPVSGQGLTQEGLARLHEAAARHVGDKRVPGLVALVARGQQVHVEALGSLSVGGPPVARDSLFRIASMSKPITAAATLAVIAEGLVSLDEPVDRLLPELADRRVLARPDGPLEETVPAARAITTRDLLTFTFGFGMAMEMFMAATPWPIVTASEDLQLATIGPPDPALQPDPDTWIAGLGALPLIAQPGERWLYNTGSSVLGVLLARATGEPFAEVLRTRIFEPLAMRDTTFWTAHTERLATVYQATPAGLAVWDPPDGDWSRPPAFGDGGAGLVSTVDDVLAFSRMLLRGGSPVLSALDAAAMCADQLSAAQKARGGLGPGFFASRSWGFGQAVMDDGSFGWDGGLGSTWLNDPARDLTIIVLTQRMFETHLPPRVHREIQAAAYDALP